MGKAETVAMNNADSYYIPGSLMSRKTYLLVVLFKKLKMHQEVFLTTIILCVNKIGQMIFEYKIVP